MDVKIEPSWKAILKAEFEKDYFTDLAGFVKKEYKSGTVYPPGSQIFRAFNHCPLPETKVVIIGQDPYHGPGQANGLCFSVNEGLRFPPSLLNIFKEIKNDLGQEIPPNGSLTRWADQGVLMLNATLTVRARSAGSHQNKGWEQFTDATIHELSKAQKNLVFLLWGAYAQKKGEVISGEDHLILKAPHPSPFSADRGFFGCKHFSQTNKFLTSRGLTPINW